MKTLSMLAAVLMLHAAPVFGDQHHPAAYLAGANAGVSKIGEGEARFFGGAAVHYTYLPGIAAELVLDYQAPDTVDEVEVRTVPVTVSGLIDLYPPLLAAGGFGWYMKRVEWTGVSAHSDTDGDFGWHLGGGIRLARDTGPQILIEARRHWLDPLEIEDPPPGKRRGRLDPDFWSAHVGLMLPLP